MLPATLAVLMACGGMNAEAPGYPNDRSMDDLPGSSPAPSSLPPLSQGHLWRYDVMKVISPGLGEFLQRVEVKEVLQGGRFHGWSIVALKGEPAFWQGVGLAPGDVVTRVNGSEIGHYEKAYEVASQLATASEIVVSYERGGVPKELRYVIHDDQEAAQVAKQPIPATSAVVATPAPPASAAPASSAPASSK